MDVRHTYTYSNLSIFFFDTIMCFRLCCIDWIHIFELLSLTAKPRGIPTHTQITQLKSKAKQGFLTLCITKADKTLTAYINYSNIS